MNMDRIKVLNEINNMLEVIKTSPELFHDGIDEEIMQVLKYAKKYIQGD